MNNIAKAESEIFHLASPIRLDVERTDVFLEDYFKDVENITGLHCHEKLHAELSDDKKNLILTVTDETLPPVSILEVETVNDKYDLIVLKSRKIKHRITYDPNGGHINSMQIGGSFNNWNASEHNFFWEEGKWHIDLLLEPGIYTYQLIADGNWFCDPANPNSADNGYGSYNSILEVSTKTPEDSLNISTSKSYESSIIVTSDIEADEFFVLWQNKRLKSPSIFRNINNLMISLPAEAKQMQRSFIRVFAYRKNELSNDLLIPLQNGNIFYDSSFLTRNDKEASSIYFALVDRFCNGNPENDQPINDPNLHPKLNFHGGDLAGIIKKIKDGYFTKLGINTIWISPIVQNPETVVENYGHKCAGYHGYWPVNSTRIDHRFGTPDEMITLVNLAHAQNINVILDFVSNHVHEDNSLIKNNPDWKTPLYLPDGSKNIGRWDEHRLTTWFEEFLPTLDFDNPEVLDTVTEFALFWIMAYKLDGFRHDATKHVPEVFWRALTKKLKDSVMLQENKRLYQIGETFGGRELLAQYLNSGMMDGQFSFNVYYEIRSAFAKEEEHFDQLVKAYIQDLQAFGYHNLMGYITGNHDLPRFISYAGEDLAFHENAEHEGWHRHISVKNPVGYKRLSLLTAFITTIPGIPVIYYGDEIGIAGGSDPDNRRPMKFEWLSPEEASTLSISQKLFKLRKKYMSLVYGSIKFLTVEQKMLSYRRNYFEEVSLIAINKSSEKALFTFELNNFDSYSFISHFDHSYTVEDNILSIEIEPYSFEVLISPHTAKQTLKKQTSLKNIVTQRY